MTGGPKSTVGDEPPPDEFRLIADLFAPLSLGCPGALGLTDDAAFLPAEPGFDTVATMDAMVAGVHFLPDDPADLVARKLVRVNLSDLAAKGAEPRALMLAAAFPKGVSAVWLRRFAAGLAADVAEFAVPLIGGDTVSTPGPLTLTLTALGRVAAGRGVLRRNAVAGDDIWVSGTIGDAALGLKALVGTLDGLNAADSDFLADRYRLPQPRVGLAKHLAALAHAGMDVSDGLVQDLGHICRTSGLGAEIQVALVPLSPAAARVVAADRSHLAAVLAGGDDYEVLFTASPQAAPRVAEVAAALALSLTRIGRMVAGSGVTVLEPDGGIVPLSAGGWRHFGGEGE